MNERIQRGVGQFFLKGAARSVIGALCVLVLRSMKSKVKPMEVQKRGEEGGIRMKRVRVEEAPSHDQKSKLGASRPAQRREGVTWQCQAVRRWLCRKSAQAGEVLDKPLKGFNLKYNQEWRRLQLLSVSKGLGGVGPTL